METDHQDAIERATRLLKGHTKGTLLADSTPYDSVRYLVDPRTGSLVLSIEEAILDADDVVLVIPEDRFDAPMRVSLDLSTTIEEEACDRFLAYHLHQPSSIWALGRINFAKLESGEVVGTDELEIPNPLIDALAGLCKKLNTDRKALGEVCKLLTKAKVDEPLAVGIDPIGMDVRTKFGVLRVEFPSPVEDATQAEDVIAALYGGVS
jgi:uncharacterized protein DUF2470